MTSLPATAPATRLQSRIGVCYACEAIFILPPGQMLTEPLPCGHPLGLYLTESSILAALRDADFLEWADRNGAMDVPLQALRDAGGSYNPWATGQGRLRLPTGGLG